MKVTIPILLTLDITGEPAEDALAIARQLFLQPRPVVLGVECDAGGVCFDAEAVLAQVQKPASEWANAGDAGEPPAPKRKRTRKP